jgi:hypothetical protein
VRRLWRAFRHHLPFSLTLFFLPQHHSFTDIECKWCCNLRPNCWWAYTMSNALPLNITMAVHTHAP